MFADDVGFSAIVFTSDDASDIRISNVNLAISPERDFRVDALSGAENGVIANMTSPDSWGRILGRLTASRRRARLALIPSHRPLVRKHTRTRTPAARD